MWYAVVLSFPDVFALSMLAAFYWFSGDNESGKTTLVSKLRGVEEQKTGSALEYMYITVKDEYGDGTFVDSLHWMCVISSLL